MSSSVLIEGVRVFSFVCTNNAVCFARYIRIFPSNAKVRAWLNTKQGQGRVMEENKRRKAAKKFRIGTIDSSTATLKVRVRTTLA